jgi:hypothetical protein
MLPGTSYHMYMTKENLAVSYATGINYHHFFLLLEVRGGCEAPADDAS